MKSPISIFIIVCFFITSVIGTLPMANADEYSLPTPGVMVQLSPEFNPPILKGIKVHPENPFRFDFILDVGDGSKPSPNGRVMNPPLREESTKLIKYFLASLTIPEKDLWVNLSPYEKDRIIPQSFGQTEMGRDLLTEDYMLKQITASLIYPEGTTGKKFWKRIYEEAAKRFGTTNIPVSTFNKVWIVPDKAVVYENAKAGTAYVVESKLKVMLEQDYLSLEKHQSQPGDMARAVSPSTLPSELGSNAKASQGNNHSISELGSQIVREIIIPELTREVNQDKNFAQLRQVYSSLILAQWYKNKIKDSILAQVYEDKNKVKGILSSPNASVGDPEHIYQQYLKAFKKGVYNYIKEEQDAITQEMIPRKYFSGGFKMAMTADKVMDIRHDSSMISRVLTTGLLALGITLVAPSFNNILNMPPAHLVVSSSNSINPHLMAETKSIFDQLINDSYLFQPDEFNDTKTIKALVDAINAGFLFRPDEFKGTMTAEALVKTIQTKGIKVPMAKTPIESLNLLLKDKELYLNSHLPVHPDKSLDYLETIKTRPLNPYAIIKLNRFLIEANFSSETPSRPNDIQLHYDVGVEPSVDSLNKFLKNDYLFGAGRVFYSLSSPERIVSRNRLLLELNYPSQIPQKFDRDRRGYAAVNQFRQMGLDIIYPLMDILEHGGLEKYEDRMEKISIENEVWQAVKADRQLVNLLKQGVAEFYGDMEDYRSHLKYYAKTLSSKEKELLNILDKAYYQDRSTYLPSFLGHIEGQEGAYGILTTLAESPEIPKLYKTKITRFLEDQKDGQRSTMFLYTLFISGLIYVTWKGGKVVVKWRYHIPIFGKQLINRMTQRIEWKISKGMDIDDDLEILGKASWKYVDLRLLTILSSINNPSQLKRDIVNRIIGPLTISRYTNIDVGEYHENMETFFHTDQGVDVIEGLIFKYFIQDQYYVDQFLKILNDVTVPSARQKAHEVFVRLLNLGEKDYHYANIRIMTLKRWAIPKEEKLRFLKEMPLGPSVLNAIAELEFVPSVHFLAEHIDNYYAVRALGEMKIPEAQDILGGIASDPKRDPGDRLNALGFWHEETGLKILFYSEIIEDLLKVVRVTGNMEESLKAVNQLGGLDKHKDALQAITLIIESRSLHVAIRREAVKYLKSFDAKDVVFWLKALEEDLQYPLRSLADAEVLNRFWQIDRKLFISIVGSEDIPQRFKIFFENINDINLTYPMLFLTLSLDGQLDKVMGSLKKWKSRNVQIDRIMKDIPSSDKEWEFLNLLAEVLINETSSDLNVVEELLIFKQILVENDFQDFIFDATKDLRLRIRIILFFIEIFSVEEATKESPDVQLITPYIKDVRSSLSDMMKRNMPRKKMLKLSIEKMNVFRKGFLVFILKKVRQDRTISDKELKLLEYPDVAKKILNILSVLGTLKFRVFYGKEILEDLVSRFIDRLFTDYQEDGDLQKARQKLQEFILGINSQTMNGLSNLKFEKSNLEMIKELEFMGYSPLLWSQGIDFNVVLSKGLTKEDKENSIKQSSREMVEIAMALGIKESRGEPISLEMADKLDNYKAVKDFYDSLDPESLKNSMPYDQQDLVSRLGQILSYIYSRDEQTITDQPLAPANFRITVKKDFLNESSAGIGVPGCFDPYGLYRQMPLIHASEANAGFIQVYSQDGREVANAVIVYGQEGAYVFSAYSAIDYNLDEAFGRAIAQLTKFVPKVVLSSTSAGYADLKNEVKISKESVVITKPALIFRDQHFDFGTIDPNGRLNLNIENPLVITKEDIQLKDQEIQVSHDIVVPGMEKSIDLSELFGILAYHSNDRVNLRAFSFVFKPLQEKLHHESFIKINHEFYGWLKDIIRQRKGFEKTQDDVINQVVGLITEYLASKDAAMLNKNGGIDFTSDKALSVRNDGQSIKFHLDPAMLQQLQNAPGFVPVIINIQPLKNLSEFLGVPKAADGNYHNAANDNQALAILKPG